MALRVLLCGDSGAGKSTLAYACAKAGWTYTTDDGSYMVHGRDDLLVTGNCHQVRFRSSSVSIFPEIDGRDITQRAGVGKPSIELRPALLPGIRTSQTANIQYVVFLNRRESNNAQLRPYSKEVVRHFLRQGRFAPLEVMPLHYAMIDRLLELDVHELRYQDVDWAVEQLIKHGGDRAFPMSAPERGAAEGRRLPIRPCRLPCVGPGI